MPDWSSVMAQLHWPVLIGALALGYLLGSIPFGLLLTKRSAAPISAPSAPAISAPPMCCAPAARGSPPRRCSATCSRAPLRSLIARYLFGPEAALAAGLGAFLGHLFPVWLGFKGGKGVATFIGVLLGFSWLAVADLLPRSGSAVAAATRYSSLSGLLASAATPAILWSLGHATAGHAVLRAGAARLHHAPRQYRAPDRRAPKPRSDNPAVKP